MTTEDHLRAALKRSRKAHKATIEQARHWSSLAKYMNKRAPALHEELEMRKQMCVDMLHAQHNDSCLPSRWTVFVFSSIVAFLLGAAIGSAYP